MKKVINIRGVNYITDTENYDGLYYYHCKREDVINNIEYIIKETFWGSIPFYVVSQIQEVKERIADFSEMYDKKRNNYILRLNNDYFVFDDDDFNMDCTISARKITDGYKNIFYVLRQEVEDRKVVAYIIEYIYEV